MKETFKNVANKVKTTGKKAISIAKKNPAATAITGLAVTIGICTVMKNAQKQKESDAYAKGYNQGASNGSFEAMHALAHYLAGKTGTPYNEITKELDTHCGPVTYKVMVDR